MPYDLTLGCEAGAKCAKCEAGTTAKRPGSWTLTDGKTSWPLCGNHAADAAHRLQIPARCFTPHLLPKETEHGQKSPKT